MLNSARTKYMLPLLLTACAFFLTNTLPEHSFARSHQRVWGQQVEGNWTEDWQTSEGRKAPMFIFLYNVLMFISFTQACEQYAKEHFKNLWVSLKVLGHGFTPCHMRLTNIAHKTVSYPLNWRSTNLVVVFFFSWLVNDNQKYAIRTLVNCWRKGILRMLGVPGEVIWEHHDYTIRIWK